MFACETLVETEILLGPSFPPHCHLRNHSAVQKNKCRPREVYTLQHRTAYMCRIRASTGVFDSKVQGNLSGHNCHGFVWYLRCHPLVTAFLQVLIEVSRTWNRRMWFIGTICNISRHVLSFTSHERLLSILPNELGMVLGAEGFRCHHCFLVRTNGVK